MKKTNELNCRTIQNFGEQHPLFYSKKMNEYRKDAKHKKVVVSDKKLRSTLAHVLHVATSGDIN